MKKTATVKRVANNTFFILIARASELISGLLIIAMITRYLGVKDFGIYAFITAAALMLAPVIAFGSARIIIREISVNKEQTSDFVTAGLILNGCISLLALAIAALIAISFKLSSTVYITALFLSVLAQTLLVMSNTVKIVFIAFEKAIYNSITTTLTRLLAIMSIVSVTFLDMGFIYLFVAMTAVNAFGLFFSFCMLHFKIAEIKLTVNIQRLKYLFLESIPVAIAVFFAQSFIYINVFLLKIYQDVIQISFFQAPQRAITPLILIYGALILAASPAFARAAARNSINDLKYFLNKMLKYTFILIIPICLCVTMFSPKIVLLLFGKQFSGATVPFQILIWLIIPAFINGLFSQILTLIKKQRVLIISNCICFIFNLLLGLILVNKYAAVGLCWASLFSYVVLVTINFYFLAKYLVFIPIHQIIFRPLVACIIMWGFLYKLVDRVNMVLLIIFFFGTYFSLLLLFRTFSSNEIDAFKIALFRRLNHSSPQKN